MGDDGQTATFAEETTGGDASTATSYGAATAWVGRTATVYAPPLFTVSTRTTHMDIMVTTNTAKRYVEPGERKGLARRLGRGGKLRARCKLPYELTLGSPSPDTSATTTLAQVLVDGISRRRTNDAMHEERRLFMQRLVRERDLRTEDEHKSSVLVQAMFRGRLERRRTQHQLARDGSDEGSQGSPGPFGVGLGGPRGPKWTKTEGKNQNSIQIHENYRKSNLFPLESLQIF